MTWLRQHVVTAAQFAAFTILIVHLEQCSVPLAESPLSKSQYLTTLQCVVWGVLALYVANPAFLQKLQRLLFDYGWMYPRGRSTELRRDERWFWRSRGTTAAGLKELAKKLRDLLSEQELRQRILLHLYQVLIVEAQYSVIMDVDPFSADFDALLIRGACQYGKTLEAVLLAWLVWWQGEVKGEADAGHCVSYIFTMSTGTKQSKSSFADKVEKLNIRIDNEITENFPMAPPALRELFHLHYSTAYPKDAPKQAHVVLKACNPSGSLTVKDKELSRMVRHGGCMAAAADHPVNDDGTIRTDISSLRCYLIYDEDDVNMQGKNRKTGRLFKTEDGRNQLCDVMEFVLEPAAPTPAAAAATAAAAAADDSDVLDDGADDGVDAAAVLGQITRIRVRVKGRASITATPEGLIGSKSQMDSGTRWQVHDMLAKGVNPQYYGYDKRVPIERRTMWETVPEDWKELPKPPRAPRQPSGQQGTGVAKKIKKKPCKRYQLTRAGLKAMLTATLGDTTRPRRILLYPNLQPAVRKREDSIEVTQAFVLNWAQRMGASALVVTYCGGPQHQDLEKLNNGFRYSCVLVATEDIEPQVMAWFSAAHGGCGCGECGHCVVARCRTSVGEDGKVYFAGGTLAKDLCSILETCGLDLAAASAAAGTAGVLRPHVVIVTGRMATRGVSFRSYDGKFYVCDQYVAYIPERSSSNTTVHIKQVFGRICACLDFAPDGPLRVWTSEPVKQDFDWLVANGDALWRGLEEGVPVAELLISVPMYRTAGRGSDSTHLHKPNVVRHLKLTGGTTMRRANIVYTRLNEVLAETSDSVNAGEPCSPAFVAGVLQSDIKDVVEAMRHGNSTFSSVRIMSKVHRRMVPQYIGNLNWHVNGGRIKAWLQEKFPGAKTVSPNSAGHESWQSWSPARKAMQENHWPDLWWEVEDEAERRIVIIEHTMPFEAAKRRTHAKNVNVFHRFMMHCTEPHMVEITATFKPNQVQDRPDARIRIVESDDDDR